MKKTSVVVMLSAIALVAKAQSTTNLPAPTVTVREMSLKDCIELSLAHNFDVQIQRYDPVIELAALNAAHGGFDPTLTISGDHQHSAIGPDSLGALHDDSDSFSSQIQGTAPWGMGYTLGGSVAESQGQAYSTTTLTAPATDASQGTVGMTITQPLLKNLWIDGTRLKIELAKSKLQQSEQTLRNQLITTVAAVQIAYYELIYARQNVEVQQQALTLAQTQLDQDRQRVRVGSLAPLDVQQDESQVASNRASLITAQNTLSLAQNTLKNLLTDAYRQWAKITIQPAESLSADLHLFDLQDCWGKGMTHRPDLLSARMNVEQQGITLKYDRNQLYPELDLKGSYGFNGNGREFSSVFGQYGEGNRPYYSYGASLSLPLSNTGARNTLKGDKATLQQLLLTLKQLEQTVMVSIDNAVKQVASDYEGVQASKQATLYAAAALDAEEKKYHVGKSTTFTVLQLQNTLTADRGAEIRSIANYDEDIAKLAQAEGTTLEELNISLEVK